MARAITYEELIDMAKKHYNEGGDGIVECWDEHAFNTYVEMFGPITERTAMSLIRLGY